MEDLKRNEAPEPTHVFVDPEDDSTHKSYGSDREALDALVSKEENETDQNVAIYSGGERINPRITEVAPNPLPDLTDFHLWPSQ